MAIQLYINGILIPEESIISLSKSDQELSYTDKLIAATSDVKLNNASSEYSDMSPTSIFYGSNWYDNSYEVYNTDTKLYTFVGKIKNIIQNDSDMSVTIKATNYIRDIFTTVAVMSETNITPSEAINKLLLYVGIPVNYLDNSTFTNATGYQVANGLLVDVSYTSSNNVMVGNAINELLKISQCSLYSNNNVIAIYQYQDYAGESGFEIKNKILPGSFSTEYTNEIYNKWYIAYKSGAAVLYSTGTKTGTSLDLTINIPDTSVGTASADYRIICSNLTSAAFAGYLVTARNFCPKKIVSFSTSFEFDYVTIGTQIDLTYGDYYREPIIITSIKADTDKRVIEFKGEFRNLPIERYSRDVTAPDAPIISAFTNITNIYVDVTKCYDVDFDHYNIYFGVSESEMESEYCTVGISPISVLTMEEGRDGYNVVRLFGLTYDIPYYIKATCVDTTGNESEFSNTVICTLVSGDAYTRITTDGDTRIDTSSNTRILNVM